MALLHSTDREWEKFGEKDPYFGVASFEENHKQNLTETERETFFQSGREHIDGAMAKIRTHLDADFAPQRSLDYGCGVGRLVIPLASVSKEVVGVDISPSMLKEAAANCASRGLDNVSFVKADDELSNVTGKFDLIHSIIVLQHIDAGRGYRIFENLLKHTSPGAVGVLHFTYPGSKRRLQSAVLFVKKYVPFGAQMINLLRGRKFSAPSMQMNVYDLNRICRTLQEAKVQNVFLEFTDHGGYFGAVVYFKMPD